MSKSIPFYRYPPTFWNSLYDILTEETKATAQPEDLCFLCDGYLFLIQDPYHKANLICQSITQHLHPTPIIKHICKLVIELSNLSLDYLYFSGKGNRYNTLYNRLYKTLFNCNIPHILKVSSTNEYESYVLHITPFVIEYCNTVISSIDYINTTFNEDLVILS